MTPSGEGEPLSTVAVVQARMGSTRLPGKVLADLGGRPMLALMLERLEPLVGHGIDRLVLATSDLALDDPVADLAAGAGATVVRGSELDVLGRFLTVLDHHPADTLVRLTADCPLMDPAIVVAALETHRRSGAAYTSNTLVRTYPDGLDVEVVAATALRQAGAEATDPGEREHVTPFVYRRPARFALRAIRSGADLGQERWTVDTADDLDDLRQILDGVDSPTRASWTQILAVAGRRRGPAPGQLWLRPTDRQDAPGLTRQGRPLPPGRLDHLDDASTRTWSLERDDLLGWLSVAVEDGEGRLVAALADPDRAEALRLLDRALAADQQVVRLVEG
jgi:spore coat polysaccharide biosynthesis protein SpsF